jgi:hypothetical protein
MKMRCNRAQQVGNFMNCFDCNINASSYMSERIILTVRLECTGECNCPSLSPHFMDCGHFCVMRVGVRQIMPRNINSIQRPRILELEE